MIEMIASDKAIKVIPINSVVVGTSCNCTQAAITPITGASMDDMLATPALNRRKAYSHNIQAKALQDTELKITAPIK